MIKKAQVQLVMACLLLVTAVSIHAGVSGFWPYQGKEHKATPTGLSEADEVAKANAIAKIECDAAFPDGDAMVACIKEIQKGHRFCKDLTFPTSMTTYDAGDPGNCKIATMNIEVDRFAQTKEKCEELASTLVHEAYHAMDPLGTPGSPAREARADRKQGEFLRERRKKLFSLRDGTTDPDELAPLAELIDWLDENAIPRSERSLRESLIEASAKLDLPKRAPLAVYVELPVPGTTSTLAIAASEPSVHILRDVRPFAQTVSFRTIERPLSAALANVGGLDVLLVAGTFNQDSSAAVESFEIRDLIGGGPVPIPVPSPVPGEGEDVIVTLGNPSTIHRIIPGIHPTSVFFDASMNEFIVWDRLSSRLIRFRSDVLSYNSPNLSADPIVIASANLFPTLRLAHRVIPITKPSASPSEFFVDFRGLNSHDMGPREPVGVLSDTDEDGAPDVFREFTFRELTLTDPTFLLAPQEGDSEIGVLGTFGSTIEVRSESEVLARFVVGFGGPENVQLPRPLVLGESVTLIDLTIGTVAFTAPLSEIVGPRVPEAFATNHVAVLPHKPQVVKIFGRNFAPDSKVFVRDSAGEIGARVLRSTSDEILVKLPPLQGQQPEPGSTRFVLLEVRSASFETTSVNLQYVHHSDFADGR